MKVKVLQDYNVNTNDFKYNKDDVIEVTSLYGFDNSYAIYHNLEKYTVLDWIPKLLVEVI